MCLGRRYRTSLLSLFGRLAFCLIPDVWKICAFLVYRVQIIICRTWSYFIAYVACRFAPLSTARVGCQICDKGVDAQGIKMGSVGVPWRGIRISVVALEKQQVLHIQSVCFKPQLSRRQSACAVLCRPLWPVRFYRIFGHYLTRGTILGGKVIENKTCILVFSTAFV